MSMKNSNDTTENRTRDLPSCGAVPQPTAPGIIVRCREISVNTKRTEGEEGEKCNGIGRLVLWSFGQEKQDRMQ